MPKRLGNVYHKIYDIDNLRMAFEMAKKDKSFYKAVKRIERNPDKYLWKIHKWLKNEIYYIGNYQYSTISDKGKVRELMKLPFYPDRIVQWAILLVIDKDFVNSFCPHTCASLKNRGIDKALTLLRRYLEHEEKTTYCLKIDIHKFYPNINHTILKLLLRKKFKDPKLLRLLDMYIDSTPGDIGIPIGSYLSQFYGNFYLNYFDHWLKEDKHLKYVVRYMDDVVILHHDKEFLHNLLNEIIIYLKDELKLELKPNYQVFPVESRGIDFVGIRNFHHFSLLRKRIIKTMKKKMLRLQKLVANGGELSYTDWCSISSYNGWMMYANTYRLRKKYIAPLKGAYIDYYEKNLKSKKKNKKKAKEFLKDL